MADCKIPEIPFASGVDQNLQRILSPIKETLDIWAGRAGDSLCRHVTIEDLLDETVTVNITSTGGSGNDPDAIHDDVASEILAVSLKATPAATDLLLIEDSADSYSKKRTTFGAFSGTDELLNVSANDTTPGYLEDKFVVSHGTNTANPLELSTLNDGADEDRQLQFDESKVDHANLLNLTTGDPHTQYQQESEKSAANGYASLGATTLVPTAELGTGSASTSTYLRGDQTWQTIGAGSDELSKVSSNDTTAGYLEDKIVVASGTNTTNILELSTLNDGADEDVQIQIDEAKIDHDSLLNFLAAEHIDWALTGTEDIHVDRITASSVTQHVASIDHDSLLNTHNLTTDIDHDQLTNFTAGEHTDAQVKISLNDTTPGYLEDKLVVASGSNTTNILELSTLNEGVNEDVQIQIDEAKINHTNLLNSHNLTTDIDHNSITNTHDLTTDIDHDQLTNYTAGEHTDAQVKVSTNDTTPGYLEDKVVVSDGSNTTYILELSTLNDGLNEDVQIQIDESKIDHANLLNLATGDPHTQYQQESEKGSANGYAGLGAGGYVPTAQLGSGTADSSSYLRGDQTWAVVSTGSGDTVKVSSNDTTAGYLEDKIVVSDGSNTTNILELTTLNDGADEDVQIQIDEGKIDHANLLSLTTGDPHTQYQLESGKSAANGYASLGATTLVPTAELGTGSPDSTYYLRGDQTWQLLSGIAGSHTITSHSDVVDATGAQLEELTGGGDTTLHDHDGISENTSARHTQGTDTALGVMAADIDMNSLYQVVGLQAPAAAGEAIRQTTSITETNLETLTDNSIADALHRHSELVASDGSPDPVFSSDASGNLTQPAGLYIATDEIRAVDSGGLLLRDDSGTLGIFIQDGGDVGIGNAAPGCPLEVSGSVRSSNEFISIGTGYGSFRSIAGNYGAFWRNDGSSYYLLLTASTDQYGSWNTLRPLNVNLSTGTVIIANSAITAIDNSGIFLKNGTGINEFSIDGSLSGNSDDAVPTEKAVKTYVDTEAPKENILINQDFSIWQENTTFSSPSNLEYNADGYYVELNAGAGTLPTVNIKKNTSAQEAAYEQCCELEITNVGSAFEHFRFCQKVEEYKKYRGKSLTVTYRIKASTAVTFTGGVWVFDGVTYSPTIVNALTTSYQNFTDTITVSDSSTELRCGFQFGGTVSTICSIYIQFVKVEVGSVSTSLIPRKPEVELALCQRYYQKSYAQGTAVGTETTIGSEHFYLTGVASSNYSVYTHVRFPTMKAAPTVTIYDMAGNVGKVTMSAGNNITGSTAGIADSTFLVTAANGAVATDRALRFSWVAVSRV